MRAAFLFLLAAQALPWTETAVPGSVAPALAAIGVGLALRSIRRSPADEGDAPLRSLAAVAFLLALAAALRLGFLERLPPYLDGDATAYAHESLRFLGDDPPPLFATGPWGLTNVYFFTLSIPQRIAERSVAAVRVVGAIGGILGIVATWALARRALGPAIGLLTALVVGVLPMHLTYSRNGMEFVHVTWVAPLAILLLAEGWRRDSLRLVALAGATTAAGLYVTPAARLVAIVLAIELLLLHRFEPPERRRVKRLAAAVAAAVGGFLLLFSPMIPHYLARPETFDERVRDVSVLTSDWLAKEIPVRGIWRVWTTQIRDSLLAFHAQPSILPGPQYFWQPFLLPHDSALLTIGLLVALARARRSALVATLLVWLAAGCLFGGILTVTTPKTTRYVILLPVAAMLVALGLERVLRGEPSRTHGRWSTGAALAAYAAVGIAASFVHDGRTTWRYDRTGQVATAAGLRLARAGDPPPEVFFLSTPLIHFGASPALAYLSGTSGVDLAGPLDCRALAARRTRERTILLAPAERADELRSLAARIAASGGRPRVSLDLDPAGGVVVAILEIRAAPGDAVALCGPSGSGRERAELRQPHSFADVLERDLDREADRDSIGLDAEHLGEDPDLRVLLERDEREREG